MADVFDSSTDVPLGCTECGRDFTKKLGWLKSHSEFPCDTVGCPAVFDAKELIKGFDKANRDIDRTFRDIEKGFKF